MKVTWTKEKKPHIFELTGREYARMSLEELEDRGFLTPEIKALLAELPEGCWLAGSWFESLFRGEKPKDLDMFFRDEEAFYALVEVIQDPADPEDEEQESPFADYEMPEESLMDSLVDSEKTTAISLKSENRPTIQLVKSRFYDSAVAVIDSFDFTVCQFALGKDGLVFNPAGMLDLVRKRLVLHKMTFPASTMRRMIKYTQKGYFACGGSFIKMVEEMKKTPADDAEVLYVD